MPELPPFCPNMECENHRQPEGKRWYRPFGWFYTKARGKVKRYACRRCGKSFSEQTFRLSYYLHLNIDFKKVLYRTGACSGIRAIARSFGVTDKVIANRVGRLARQTIGVMAGLRCSQDCDEALVAIGVESINNSKCTINLVHLLIGQESEYVYAGDACDTIDLTLLSSGELSASFERICHVVDDLAGNKDAIVLYTDDKEEYRTALETNQYLDGKVTHLTTSSSCRADNNRNLGNDLAAQAGKTTHWSQEPNKRMEQIYVSAGFHNFFKPLRDKQRDLRTPAEMSGLDVKRMCSLLGTFFTKRFFYSKIAYTISDWLVWLRAYQTHIHSSSHYLPGYITCKERLGPWARAA